MIIETIKSERKTIMQYQLIELKSEPHKNQGMRASYLNRNLIEIRNKVKIPLILIDHCQFCRLIARCGAHVLIAMTACSYATRSRGFSVSKYQKVTENNKEISIKCANAGNRHTYRCAHFGFGVV